MKGKIICIVIALMVLSVSAILVANPNILGGFSSTLNGVPVQVAISRQDNGTITTMLTEDLLENWADYNERFVRFTGIVKSVDRRGFKKVWLTVDALYLDDEYDLFVHPLDAPYLPAEYQKGHVYEFTGFLVNARPRTEIANLIKVKGRTLRTLRVYAFEIRHHGKSESLREAEAVERLQNAPNPLD